MRVCPGCGRESPEEFQFCPICGTSLAVLGQVKEQRKIVTTLFCDVVGSTSLGEQLDSESYQKVLFRYFEMARSVIVAHDGTVDKFVGDAVMSVFGIPIAHEDDALRAIRAAVEIRERLIELNDELECTWGKRLEVRMGISTGEVITGTGERLAVGDALNTASRLQQAASPGEILLDEPTLRLVRSSVEVETLEPLQLKGKRSLTQTYHLIRIGSEAPALKRYFDAPLIGREKEFGELVAAWAGVTETESPSLMTVIGLPGVGKSRLVAEFVQSLPNTRVLRARCLSYGEGITYWPIIEILKHLGQELEELELEDGVQAGVRNLLGEQTGITSEEIAYAIRRVFETLASQKPLLVVFDDIHWGQPAFLDLIKYIIQYSHGSPIMLLCMARPELLDRDPGWSKQAGSTLRLETLSEKGAYALTEALASNLDEDLRKQVLDTASGNPLFVEELIAYIREQDPLKDNQAVVFPLTLQTLLAARLDQLDATERVVLENGSVEGQIFHRGAVIELTPSHPQVDAQLLTLSQKELVHSTRPQIPNDYAYAFRHQLIRASTYDSIPKTSRALLHQQLANWLDRFGQTIVELDEIVGYHFEQAHNYKAQLSQADATSKELAQKAAQRLYAAGHRARLRNDVAATKNLLGRATSLARSDSQLYRDALLELAMVSFEDDYSVAKSKFDEVATAAKAADDVRVQARADIGLTELSWIHVQGGARVSWANLLQRANAAMRQLERCNDAQGVLLARRVSGSLLFHQGTVQAADDMWTKALEGADGFDDQLLVHEVLIGLCWSAWWGPLPTDHAIRRCEEIAARVSRDSAVYATSLISRAGAKAMRGQFDHARDDMHAGRNAYKELGLINRWASTAQLAADLELRANAPDCAEALIRSDLADFNPAHSYLSSTLCYLALAVAAQGRPEEALALVEEVDNSPHDLASYVLKRAARAQALAQLGHLEEAQDQTEQAVQRAQRSEYFPLRIKALQVAQDMARVNGDEVGEVKSLREIVHLAEIKSDLVSLEEAKQQLLSLRSH